ncbi:MAG: Integrase core domain protein [Deltaproteobacteria bacterium ADurb.Bin135]|jgi:hypothetical protein|nr:MAG: Integrase core domain protein [Deltaproteobacteria bacterium ADurb.Bin135]
MGIIDEIHLEEPYLGSRGMRNVLRMRGYAIGRIHVRTLMRKMGIEALYKKPRLSKPHPGHTVYPYLLRGLDIAEANSVWYSDITYIPMAKGFCYLVAVMDWASRKVLSWRLSNTLDASFCVAALEEAIMKYEKLETYYSYLKLEVWLPPWNNPRANSSKEKGATMKVNTKQRKKATQGFEHIYGKDELTNRMFHILSKGKQGIDALVQEPGIMMAQAIMDMEHEERSGPEYFPRQRGVYKWAYQPGSIYLGDRKEKSPWKVTPC